MEDLVFSTQNGNETYARSSCKEAKELEQHILGLYGLTSKDMIDLTPSGMAAISAVFHTFTQWAITRVKDPSSRGLSIIYDQELYSDTPALFTFIKSLHEPYIQLSKIDCTDIAALRKEIQNQHYKYKENTIVVFAESCSNPSGRIFSFEHVDRLKKDFKDTKLYFVIDNTWTTALSINPLDYNADIVLESCTKYLSAGRAIGGVVLSPVPGFINDVFNWRRVNGNHVSIANTREILTGIQDLHSRMITASNNCVELMKILAAKGFEMTHPYLNNHPSKARNQKLGLLKFAPPIFIAKVKTISKNQLGKKVLAMKHVEWRTSYGSAKCRVDSYPKTHDGYTEIRIAAGYDPDIDIAAVAEELLTLL